MIISQMMQKKPLMKFKLSHNKSPQKIRNRFEHSQSDKRQPQKKPTANIISNSEILNIFSLRLGTFSFSLRLGTRKTSPLITFVQQLILEYNKLVQ